MKLMTADEVKRRLAAGEDAILLSLEHWLQNAAHIKKYGELPKGAYNTDTCSLCYKYRDCSNCPLYQVEGQPCYQPTACHGVFEREPTYENALGVVAALARCKPVKTESPEQQFYIWREGEGPQGKVGLRLEKMGNNTSIRLLAVSENGKRLWRGTLLFIHNDGSVRLVAATSPDLGLDLDSDGKLRLQQEARCEP